MKQLAKGLAAMVILTACNTPLDTGNSGRVRLAVFWPGNFSIHSLPAGTRTLSVRITGSGLAQALETSLTRNDQSSQSLEMELPIGSKTVSVKALSNQNEVLAEDQQQISIQASQLTHLEMNLRELAKPTPSPQSSSSGNGAESGNPQSGNGNSSPPPTGQQLPSNSPSSEPQPVSSSSPEAPPTPVSSPVSTSNSGGGGGGSSSGSGTSSVVMTLSADPNPVSGLNYPTGLQANFANATLATDLLAQLSQNKASLNWTCTDSAQNTGCGAFSPGSDPWKKFWTPPLNQSGVFTLLLDITDQNSLHYQSSVTVTVLQGIGSITAGSGGFDGGETGGQ